MSDNMSSIGSAGINSGSDTFPPSHKELIKWAKAFPRTSQAQKKMKTSRRIVSMDDSSYARKDSGYSTDDSVKNRSLSEFSAPALSASLLMHPLNFVAIDVGNTPLSSLRSCSEFNKPGSYHGIDRHDISQHQPKSSILSRMYAWTFKTKKTRLDTSTLKHDEQIYLVEQLRFRPSTDDITYSPASLQFKSSSNRIRPKQLKYSSSGYDDYDDTIEEYRKHANKRSFLSETSLALDVVFGFSASTYKGPKEIELREFHRSTVSRVPSRSSMHNLTGIDEDVDSDDDDDSDSIHPRRSSASRGDVLPVDISDHLHITSSTAPSSSTTISSRIQTHILSLSHLQPIFTEYLRMFARFTSRYLLGGEDDFYYETIRLQPFASGAYLRGMLLAGFTNFFFTAYGLALWPEPHPTIILSPYHHMLEHMLYTLLCMQFAANICQLPFRLIIHYNCWESSRAVDVESSIELLRELVHSEYWVVNRGIGRIIDIMSAICIIIGEIYIWMSFSHDPLRPLCVSICATIVLSLAIRLGVATVFTLSITDPQVLSEARRRGLSRWDLDSLPTFVFTHNDEVNNCDCPICLCSFDMGEMLISLPCNHKHSFHAGCIRQWLQRQNSCPLCQRIV